MKKKDLRPLADVMHSYNIAIHTQIFLINISCTAFTVHIKLLSM